MRVALALLLIPTMPIVQAAAPVPVQTQRTAATDAALLKFLDDAYDQQLDLSPGSLTQLGLKTHYDRLDDYTETAAVRVTSWSSAISPKERPAPISRMCPPPMVTSTRPSQMRK